MHFEMPGRILTKLCVVGPVVMGPCTMPLIFFVQGFHMFLNAVTATVSPIWTKLWVVNAHAIGRLMTGLIFLVQGCHKFVFSVALQW